MNISEYARHRGCDEALVRRALTQGRISRTGSAFRCIDAKAADAAWPKGARAVPPPSVLAKPRRAAKAGKAAPPAPPPGKADDESPSSYATHRARREKAEADKVELQVKRMAGELLDRQMTERAVFEAFRALRDAALASCRSSAPMLAPLTDVREIQHVLEDGYRDAFGAFEAAMQARLQEIAES